MAEDTQQQPPPPGEKSGDQAGTMIAALTGLTGAAPMGVYSTPLFGGYGWDNPMGFWGYGSPYYGTYSVYRFMLRHPTVRLARAVVMSSIRASSWYYESEPDIDPKIVKRIEKTYNALRPRLMSDALRALDYGWAGFEPVWELRDGKWTLTRMKPLLVDTTAILADEKGNFAGLRPGSVSPTTLTQIPQKLVTPTKEDLLVENHKAWLYSYDSEAGNLYGRSQLENIRDSAWKDWLDTQQQLQALGGKLSGRAAIAKIPAGSYTDPATGLTRTFRDDAIVALEAFKQGNSVILTNIALQAESAELMVELAKASLVTFEVIDFGDLSPAIGGLLSRRRAAEELIFQGYLRSPRTGLEAQNGSRADAEAHTDTGTLDSQLIGNDIAAGVQTLIDADLSFNEGLPPGSVRVCQSPLVDSRATTYMEVLKLMVADPAYRAAIGEVIDTDKVVDGLDLPRDGDFDEVFEAQKAEQEAKQQQEMKAMQAGKPGDKPNGIAKRIPVAGGAN